MKFITGYTINTLYSEEVKNLISSLKKFSLEYRVYEYFSKNDWIKNCAVKAEIVLDALETEKDLIVWLDSDCIIRQYPKEFWQIPTDCNLASPRHDWIQFGKKSPVIHYDGGSGWHITGGTLAFPYSDETIKMVKEWIKLNEIQDKYVDQANLQQVLETGGYKFHPLPLSYFKVNGYKKMEDMGIDTVIEHYQASHRFKKQLENEGNNLLRT